jgi:hypothetical protein
MANQSLKQQKGHSEEKIYISTIYIEGKNVWEDAEVFNVKVQTGLTKVTNRFEAKCSQNLGR